MSKKTKMIPYRRFKQFLDAPAWEQRELGDLGSVATCRRIFKNQTSNEGDVPFFKIGTFGGDADAFISRELFEVYKYKYPYPKKGAILISASGSIGRTVEFIGEDEYFQDSNIVWLEHDSMLSDDFLKCVYEVTKWDGIEGNTIRRLYNQNILKTEIRKPGSKEQIAIGAYFKKLDQLITLHQRKLDKLKETKKAYLNQMFPAEGKRKPHIRFAGFTDDWEQRELGEIAYKVTEKNNHLSLRETFTNSAEFGIVSQTDYFDHSISRLSRLQNYYVVKPLDFVYNPRISVTAPVGPINLNKTDRVGVMSPLYTVFRTEKTNHIFLEYYFKSKVWHHFMRSNGDSGARSDRFSIKDAIFFKMEVSLPILAEQCDIADFLYVYDHLITLHQRKLQKLKDLKKAYLNEMFV